MGFQPGDIVRLKGTRKKMRVRRVLRLGDATLCVVAFYDSEKKVVEDKINAACLELVRAK